MIQKEIVKLFLNDEEIKAETNMKQEDIEQASMSSPMPHKLANIARDLVDLCSKEELTPRMRASQLIQRYDSQT